jgi:formylglycine-generating enzyme required for sulfatase activity
LSAENITAYDIDVGGIELTSRVINSLCTYMFFAWVIVGCTSITAVYGSENEFQDCPQCPVMVNVPAGGFLMGTAEADRLIDPRTGKPATNDSPQHTVTVPGFALGMYEVSVAEFGAFVSATGYEPVSECMEFSKPGSFTVSKEHGWDNPGFVQADSAPVGCISFFDAQAYAVWLSEVTGENYRLPSEAEWEYAARAGSSGPYFWGDDPALSCTYANVRSAGAHTISKRQVEADLLGFPCEDEFPLSSPAGSYLPNAYDLFDTQGNNWEWVADCNHKNYAGAPDDGSVWSEENCRFGVMRGGSYLNLVERSSATVRAGRPRSGAATNMGFRVAKAANMIAIIAAEDAVDGTAPANSAAALLFNDNCAACHGDSKSYQGVYGTDAGILFDIISDGGNNVMSMPAFSDRMSDAEIRMMVSYLIEQNGW